MKEPEVHALLEKANQSISDMLERETSDVLGHVLYETSCRMKNAYARSDA
jgi:dipeptidase